MSPLQKKESYSKYDLASMSLYNKFTVFLATLPKGYFGTLQAYVRNPIGILVPRFVVVCSCRIDMQKRKLCNEVMCRWVKTWRREKSCPCSKNTFLQPSTTNRMLRQFFGHMKRHHDWYYNPVKDFQFIGGLAREVKDLYSERLVNDDVSLNYIALQLFCILNSSVMRSAAGGARVAYGVRRSSVLQQLLRLELRIIFMLVPCCKSNFQFFYYFYFLRYYSLLVQIVRKRIAETRGFPGRLGQTRLRKY